MKKSSNESLGNSHLKSPFNLLLTTTTTKKTPSHNNKNDSIINQNNMKSLSSSYSFSSSSTDSSTSASVRLRRSMMLQTAYLGCHYEALRQDENVQKFRKRIDDEQYDTCMKWLNLQYSRLLYDSNGVISNEAKNTYSWLMVTDLCKDFSDGLRLVYLLEIIYNTKLKKELGSKTFGCLKLHKIKNHETCLNYLQNEAKLKCVGINPLDLVEGNKKMIISLLYLIKNDYERKLFKQDEANKKIRPECRKSCFILGSNYLSRQSNTNSTNRSKSQTLIDEKSERKRKHLSTQYPSVGYLIDELNARAKKSPSSNTSQTISRLSLSNTKSILNAATFNNNSTKVDQLYNKYIKNDQQMIRSIDLKYSEVNEIKNEVLDELVKPIDSTANNDNNEIMSSNEKPLYYSEILELQHDYVTELDLDLTDSGYSNNTVIESTTMKRSKSNSLESIDSKNQTDLTVNDVDDLIINEQIINSNIIINRIVHKAEYSVITSEQTDNLIDSVIYEEEQHLVETVESWLDLEQAPIASQVEIMSFNSEEISLILEDLVNKVEDESNLNQVQQIEDNQVNYSQEYQIDDCRENYDHEVYDNNDDESSGDEENTDTVIHNSSFVEADEYEDDEYKFENIDLEEKIRDLDELLENQLQHELDKITKDEQLLEILNENLINEKDNLKDIEQILSKQQTDDATLNQASYFIENLVLDYDHIKPTGFSSCLLDVIEHEKTNSLNVDLVNQQQQELDHFSGQENNLIINELAHPSQEELNEYSYQQDLILIQNELATASYDLETNSDLPIEEFPIEEIEEEKKEEMIELKQNDLLIVNESKKDDTSLMNTQSGNNNDDDGIQLEDEDQLEPEHDQIDDSNDSQRSRSESDSSSNSCRSTLSGFSSSSNRNDLIDLVIDTNNKSTSENSEIINKNTYAYALVNGSAAQIKIIDKQHCSTTTNSCKPISNESSRNLNNKKTQNNRVKLNMIPVEMKQTCKNSLSNGKLNTSKNYEQQHQLGNGIQKQKQPISSLKSNESIEEKIIINNHDLSSNNISKNKTYKSIEKDEMPIISKSKSKRVYINNVSLLDSNQNHSIKSKKSTYSNNSNKKSQTIPNNQNTNDTKINSSNTFSLTLIANTNAKSFIMKYFLIVGFILVVSITFSFFLTNESVFNMYDLFDVMSKLLN